jgi:RimJ/RimL family protein N-acetyltransferase
VNKVTAVQLIAIDPGGHVREPVGILSVVAAEACKATAAMYEGSGFQEPWIAYIALADRDVVGTCAFKSAPVNSRVEIAYYTFPLHERRGVATAMARQLVAIAHAEDPHVIVTANTLPQENASTAVLTKLGFQLAGERIHPQDGRVWEWRLPAETAAEKPAPPQAGAG